MVHDGTTYPLCSSDIPFPTIPLIQSKLIMQEGISVANPL